MAMKKVGWFCVQFEGLTKGDCITVYLDSVKK